MLVLNPQPHRMKGIALKDNTWDGPVQVEGDPQQILANSAGAPPNSQNVLSVMPRYLVRRKTPDEAARQ